MGLLEIRKNLRVDQNFIFHITNFKKYGKEEEKLIKELILYMTLHSQKNLFGEVDLDPSDFCKEMNVHRPSIFSKHKDPIYYKLRNEISKKEHLALQKKHGNMSKFRIWETKFENALLILQNERFYFSNDSVQNNSTIIELNNFTYIDKLKIKFEKVKKTKKIIYVFTPTKEFDNALKKLFLSINLKTYINLRKPSLEDLYLKLLYRIKMETRKNNTKLMYNIEELALLMNVSIKTLGQKKGFSNLKSNINRKLNKHIFDVTMGGYKKSKIEEFPSLYFKWEKGANCKYANIGVFYWSVSTEEEKKKETFLYKDLFFTELLQVLSINYIENYDKFSPNKEKLTFNFLLWLLSDEDYEIKTSKYVSVFSDIRGNKINSKRYSVDFFAALIEIGAAQNKHHFLSYENNKFIFDDKEKQKRFEYNELKDLIYDISGNLEYFRKFYESNRK